MVATKVLAAFVVVYILAEVGVHLYQTTLANCSLEDAKQSEQPQVYRVGQRSPVLDTITSHCLPKLVCQLFSLESRDDMTESEVKLMNSIRSMSLSDHPSRYSFAAHMGQLIRDVNGQGCHNFYPSCPFSNEDIMEIASKIKFK